jgi:hypothetical protein
MINISPRFPSWLARCIGIAIFVGAVCYEFSFDVFNRAPLLIIGAIVLFIAGLLNPVLVWIAYRRWGSQRKISSQFILLVGIIGSIVTLISSGFDITNVSVGYNPFIVFPLSQTQSMITAGYGIMGLWLLALNIEAGFQKTWPRRLIWFGIATGIIMAVGVLAIPKVFIPYVSLYHHLVPELGKLTGNLGWRFLYPVWVIWLGGVSQKSQHDPPALQGSGIMLI